ncbi:MAG: signal recognition particle protein [Lachnospiraceae bacterium]|jgi:signal recognition particle subunit SRP54|nr:signal recognition particle protein [Lachnospiraceae bacterium]MBR6359373.1 signal recognition particle protein [Lachnospiraceae bacterium]
MAFESLSEKLQNVFKNLRKKGRISEDDVKAAMKEVKMALLEADVNFKVVKNFIASVSERAVGTDVLNSLTPAQMVIKIVNEELISLMGSDSAELKFLPSNETTTIMMAGLQGAGKTTTACKLAGQLKNKGKRPLLVACDVYRPAAIEQLKVSAGKVNVPVFEMGTDTKPIVIVKEALEYAKKNGMNPVIVDTAGRLQIDEDMMNELISINERFNMTNILLTVDAMTGQDAVNVSETFNAKLPLTGVILTKLDGDTRGGSALSIKAVTGLPILYAGMGEKPEDLEVFHPDRMANRILGMGDILTLIEKAQADVDEEKAKQLVKKMKKAEFDYNDYYDQIQQMKKMGGINKILGMMPGMGALKGVDIDDDAFKTTEAIICSMTKAERENPKLMNPSRKRRIAQGAGVDIVEVNRLVKMVENQKKTMKQLSGFMNNKHGRPGLGKRGGFPF